MKQSALKTNVNRSFLPNREMNVRICECDIFDISVVKSDLRFNCLPRNTDTFFSNKDY